MLDQERSQLAMDVNALARKGPLGASDLESHPAVPRLPIRSPGEL